MGLSARKANKMDSENALITIAIVTIIGILLVGAYAIKRDYDLHELAITESNSIICPACGKALTIVER